MDEQNLIIYKTKDGKASVVLCARDGNVWLNQSQLAERCSHLQAQCRHAHLQTI
ncbi:MAG: hypothetical protein K9M54_09605 [Kiritimatiellales bacterium]|nr:hypothetical protein [Kiritimatiellales bacterium]MCF7864283.1 hypothetical protein [Kiritimatiellales bacterium]